MNFPDVPFDESLFDANDMMKSYWERSTENRHMETSDDVREEKTVHEELQNELYALSLDSYKEPKIPEPEAELGTVINETVGVPAVSVDAIVTEKSTSGSVMVYIVLGLVAVFLLSRAFLGRNQSRY